MRICGPKLSLCGLILSVWGIIQLTLMGVFFKFHSVALVEDLPYFEYNSTDSFYIEVNKAYDQNAQNCWIAACLYIITLLVSGWQFYINSRVTA